MGPNISFSSTDYSLHDLQVAYPKLFREEVYGSFEKWRHELETLKDPEEVLLSLFKICVEESKELITAVADHVYRWINNSIQNSTFFRTRPVEISLIACRNLPLVLSKIPLSTKNYIFSSEGGKKDIKTGVAIFPLVASSPVFLSLLPAIEDKVEIMGVPRALLLEIIHLLNQGKKIDISAYFGGKSAGQVLTILERLKIPVDLLAEKTVYKEPPERCQPIVDLVKKLERTKNAFDRRSISSTETIIRSTLKNIEKKCAWDNLADWINVATFMSIKPVIKQCLDIFLEHFQWLYQYFKRSHSLGVFEGLLERLSPFVEGIEGDVLSVITSEHIEYLSILFGVNFKAVSLPAQMKMSTEEFIRCLPDTVTAFSYSEAHSFTNSELKLLSKRCPNLTALKLEGSSVSDLTNLRFPRLRTLVLSRSIKLKNIDGLSNLPLSEVTISGSTVTNFNPLSSLAELSILSLKDSLTVDLSFATYLLLLSSLDLSGCREILNLNCVPINLISLNLEETDALEKDMKALVNAMKDLDIKRRAKRAQV